MSLPSFKKIQNYYLLPFVASLTLLFLLLPPIQTWFQSEVPNIPFRLLIQALIIFVVVYIVERLLYLYSFRIDTIGKF